MHENFCPFDITVSSINKTPEKFVEAQILFTGGQNTHVFFLEIQTDEMTALSTREQRLWAMTAPPTREQSLWANS